MAFNDITSLNLGKLLQIAYSNGVTQQLSQNFRDFEEIKSVRVGNPNGKQLNFMIQTALGVAAVQYLSPAGGAFPAGHQVSISEKSAAYKEIAATVEIEYNMWKRAQMSPAKYLEPLALEFQSKSLATKRRLAADIHGDGTGVVGQLAAGTPTVSSGALVFQLSQSNSARGHVGFFEFGDILVLRTLAGAAVSADSVLSAADETYWKVVSRNRKLDQVTLRPLNASFVETNATAPVALAGGEVFYRYAQPTIADLTAPVSDYGIITEVIPGFESLFAADGRIVHGIQMSGSTAGTQVDCGDATIDVSFLEELMSTIKVNVGGGVYRWDKLCMAPEARSALINASETDLRWQTREDRVKGTKTFGYIHEDDFIEVVSSEYCPKKRARALPKGKTGGEGKVLELHMADFQLVQVDGNKMFLKPAQGGGHQRTISQYLEAYGTLICKHPAAVGTLHNFRV